MQYKQRGFSLFLVMILMLVIALIVIVTMQSSNTELRMSSNEADRKFALTIAESGLEAAEEDLINIVNGSEIIKFNAGCTDGYCVPMKVEYERDSFENFATEGSSDIIARERCASGSGNCADGRADTVIDSACIGKTCRTFGGARYIIEYLGTNMMDVSYFRVTSRANGKNTDTTVTLESYVELQPAEQPNIIIDIEGGA